MGGESHTFEMSEVSEVFMNILIYLNFPLATKLSVFSTNTSVQCETVWTQTCELAFSNKSVRCVPVTSVLQGAEETKTFSHPLLSQSQKPQLAWKRCPGKYPNMSLCSDNLHAHTYLHSHF